MIVEVGPLKIIQVGTLSDLHVFEIQQHHGTGGRSVLAKGTALLCVKVTQRELTLIVMC